MELLIGRYGVDKLLDAPCGAMAWMPLVVERVRKLNKNFQYYGVDVVPTVVAKNKARFKGSNYYQFKQADISKEKLPSGYKMILSRDALQHLSYELIVPILEVTQI